MKKVLVLICMLSMGSLCSAQAPSLGTAANFAVLAGAAVTCTGGTITGNVGVSPGTAVTQTGCTIVGTVHSDDSVAIQANSDFFSAYAALAPTPTDCDAAHTLLSTITGPVTLSPGVYCTAAALTGTGVLTLNGSSTDIWIFKIGTGGTGALTGTNFSVVTPNGTPPPCNNVFWWVAEAATMTDSQFAGTILAGAAITLTRGTFNGDAFAKAAVTITGTAAGCGGHIDIDHYECYKAKPDDKFEVPDVRLEDQFGVRNVRVKDARLICTPVVKNGTFPDDLRNAIDHLVCYDIGAGGREGNKEGDEQGDKEGTEHRGVLVDNEFGLQQPLTVKRPQLLCVPSFKTLSDHDDKDKDKDKDKGEDHKD